MSGQEIALIVTALAGLIGTVLGWRKWTTEHEALADERERAARIEAGDTHVDLLRTAIEAYGRNVTQLQTQLTDTRNEANTDRERHSREMSEVRAALSKCEHERVDQARELAAITARLDEQLADRMPGGRRKSDP